MSSAQTQAQTDFQEAIVLIQQEHFDKAEPLLKRVLQSAPNHTNSHQWLSIIALKKADSVTAVKHINRAIDSAPKRADLVFNRAMLYVKLHRNEQVIRDLKLAIEIDPNFYPAYRALGDLYHQQKNYTKSIAAYEQGLQFHQHDTEVWSHLGLAHMALNHAEKAMQCFEQSLLLTPNQADHYAQLGVLHRKLGQWEQAQAVTLRAIALSPNNRGYVSQLLYTNCMLCDWTDRDELLSKIQMIQDADSESELTCFSALSYPLPPETLLALAKSEAETIKTSILSEKLKTRFRHNSLNRPRLRIGYISSSFRNFPTGHLTHRMYALHCREQFQIVAYSYSGEDNSLYRQCIQEGVDQFVDITDLSFKEAAERIYNDGIDILVDLMGSTGTHRMGISALRPAPINVRYLGSPCTSGAEYFDYLISDAYLSPLTEAHHFSEKLVLMPHTYQVTSEHAIASPQSREAYGLPSEGLVLCAFNNNYKIEPEIFAVWMRLMKAIPHSVLWLMQKDKALANLQAVAEKFGVSGERLISASRLPKDEHLARLSHATLFLDTPIYNAHTTASDVLYAGVPIITCSGNTFQSRVAGSVLRALNLADQIALNLADYEARALNLLNNPEKIVALKARIAEQRITAPLFNTEGFVRHLEEAYQTMWQQFQKGTQQHIIVKE